MGKINAQRVMCQFCGRPHASATEYNRCVCLHEREKRGEIKDLRCQVKFELIPEMHYKNQPDERPVVYTADFVYKQKTGDGWRIFVEDTKSKYTRTLPDYVLRRKIFKQRYCTGNQPYIFVEVVK